MAESKRRCGGIRGLLLAIAWLWTGSVVAAPLQVRDVTPAGTDVPAGGQISISFSQAMVPLGRMVRDADAVPVRISPDPGCQWRWLDPAVLTCELPPGRTLQPATAYAVEVPAGLRALSGDALQRRVEHRFVTERPRVRYAQVVEWRGATEPLLRISFSQPVTAASVAAALRLGGVALDVEADPFDARTPFYTPQGEARRIWRVAPQRPLRPAVRATLQVDTGLASALGPLPGRPQDPGFELTTFPALRFLGLQCQVDGELQRFEPGVPAVGCAPLGGVALAFSAPVAAKAVAEVLTIDPDDARRAAEHDPGFDPWANVADTRPVGWRHAEGQVYAVRLPFALKAEASYALTLAAGLTDRFGRVLDAPARVSLETGPRAPRFVFDHRQAVVESDLATDVPAVVTNLDDIEARYDRMTASGLDEDQTLLRPVDDVRNVAFAMPLGVRDMVAAHSGAVLGSLRPRADGQVVGPEQGHAFFAQVTPWQVHVKFGHGNTLVWASRMSDGGGVADARIELLDGFGGEVLAAARTDAEGVAQLPGAADIDPRLERAWREVDQSLIVRVRQGEDQALLPLQHAFEVDTWQASNAEVAAWRRTRHAHLRAWGTTAQGVYRAGDTVQYKLYVRDDAGERLAPAPAGRYTLRVYDAAGTVVHQRENVDLDAFGALDGAFDLATQAAVGWYRFEVEPSYAEVALEAMRMLVADFTPAPFRVHAALNAEGVEAGQLVEAEISAELHGGGAFAQAPVRALARIEPQAFTPQQRLARRFSFDSAAPDTRPVAVVLDQRDRLDAQGRWRTSVTVPDSDIYVGRLLLEGSVDDDRGRSISARVSRPLRGRDRMIGLRYDDWIARAGEATQVDALVVDMDGTPLAGVPYYVKVERKQTRGARVKGAGNAYLTRYSHQWSRVETCKGRSQVQGMRCRFVPDAAGQYRITAMLRDSHDRLQQTQTWIYVQGPQAVVWEDTPDYALELQTDQDRYRVGQTARILVKNPFPGARALVTVERYGVLMHRLVTLATATETIELPIEPEYLPGAYVSVVVQSPRVAAPVEAGVDLGKPTFRMGYLPLQVDDPYRRIDVAVNLAARDYRPRAPVAVTLQASAAHDDGGPIAFAVAVVDEAVLDLIGDGTAAYDPLRGFTVLDPLDLGNYSLLTRLVGRQKFEKKGANAGGDGGSALSLRAIDRFVAYWNPSLSADAAGSARFEFTLPDQLTGWRVLAMAVTPGDRMGLGQGQIRVNKPTELRALLPGRLAVGDEIHAEFSLLNRSDHARDLEVSLQASGAATGVLRQTVPLQAYERRTLALPLSIGDAGVLKIEARAGDAEDRDALVTEVPIRRPRWTAAAADWAVLTAGQVLDQTISPPPGGDAQLELRFSPTLVGGLDGAFGYMRDYPYACWEQQISRATMAAYYLKLHARLGDTVEWPGAAELIEQTLAHVADYQTAGGGMAFFKAADGYESPYLSAYTALAFARLQRLGYAPPEAAWERLDHYLEGLLREDPAVRGYRDAPARTRLRAVTLAALAPRGRIGADALQRVLAHAPELGLFGESLMLDAARQLAPEQMPRLRDRILSRAQASAGQLALRDDAAADEAALLGSSLRAQCAALAALVEADAQTAAGDADERVFKLARHVNALRGQRTHWSNTQENLFCTAALLALAERYETSPPELQIAVELDHAPVATVELSTRSRTLQQPLPAAGGGDDAGVPQSLKLTPDGHGHAYVDTRLRYRAPEQSSALAAGLAVERRYSVLREGQWQALSSPLRLRRGERVMVELSVDVPAQMSYVVVDDPVPAAIEPLNPDLANAAGLDLEAALNGGAYPYPFYHRELRFDAVRHYADWIEAGRYRLVWFGQVTASGTFAVGPAHAERMYAPDVYGNSASARVIVDPPDPAR
ncbi:MAG: alpha-2-macroglobulin family protein [Nevskiales bacterium]|nr:alpha-2-macroglobulin family protein [Nevskiales bacterium]